MTDILSIFGPRFVGQKKLRVFLEVIPCGRRDIKISVATEGVNIGGRLKDAYAYESCDNAVPDIEKLCACVFNYVLAEDLFLVIGEVVKPFTNEFINAVFMPFKHEQFAYGDEQQAYGAKQNKPQDLAVLICKVRNTESLKDFYRGKQQEPRKYNGCYQITWSEFQDFKASMNPVNHIQDYCLYE